jgi:hypothetical protein
MYALTFSMKFRELLNIKFFWLFIVSLIGFFAISFFSNYVYDDFHYRFIYDANGLTRERVKTISDIFYSQYNHYFIHSGRVLIHFIVQFFLMLDHKIWFDIANTIVFGLFQILIILNVVKSNRKIPTLLYLVLLLSLWFVVPGQNYCMFWLTGSVNYLWATTAALALIYLHNRVSTDKSYIKSRLILVFFTGFLLNATHEVVSISVSISFFLYYIFHYRQISPKAIALVLGAFIGTLFEAASPGNFQRAVIDTSSTGGAQTAPSSFVLNENYTLITILGVRIFILLFVIGILILIFKKKLFVEICKEQQLYLGAMIVSLIFACYFNAFSQRAIFPAAIFALVILMSTVLRFSGWFSTKWLKYSILICFLILSIEYSFTLNQLILDNPILSHDLQILEKSAKRVTIFPYTPIEKNRFVCATSLGNLDTHFVTNDALSRIYGKPYIVFFPSNVCSILMGIDSVKNSVDNHPLAVYFRKNAVVFLETQAVFQQDIKNQVFVEYKQVSLNNGVKSAKRSSCRFASTAKKSYIFFFVNKDFDFNSIMSIEISSDFKNKNRKIKYVFSNI